MPSTNRLLRLAFPVGVLALCGLLWVRIARNAAALDAVPNAVGPAGWPRAMIVGLALFAIMYFVSELLQWRSAIRMGEVPAAGSSGDDEGNQKLALIGVGVILLYGLAIPKLGFAFATVLFLAIWCALGRVRSPITIALVSVIGTVVLLYMFVALAKMPLDRGEGVMGTWTVAVYRLLRIY